MAIQKLSIPVEVCLQIFSHVDRAEEKRSLRLVGRSFALAGFEHLTTRVRMSNFGCDLDRLIEISQNDVLQGRITELVMHTPMIDPNYWEKTWWSDYWKKRCLADMYKRDNRHQRDHGQRICVPRDRDGIYSKFRELCAQILSFDQDDRNQFIHALERMPNISKITISADHLSTSSTMPLTDAKQIDYMMLVLAQESAASAKLRIQAIVDRTDQRVSGAPHCDRERPSDERRSDSRVVCDLETGIRLSRWNLSSVTTIDLQIDMESQHLCRLLHNPDVFFFMLAGLRNLKHLSLRKSEWANKRRHPLGIESLLHSFSTPQPAWKLESLALYDFTIFSQPDLARLLKGHSETLERIRFHKLQIYSGNWDKFPNWLWKEGLKVNVSFDLVIGPPELYHCTANIDVHGVKGFLDDKETELPIQLNCQQQHCHLNTE